MLKIIHTYRVKKRKHAIFGKFLKSILKTVLPKLSRIRKRKTKGIILRSNITISKSDGLQLKFLKNGVIPLKRRLNPWNKRILGPTLTEFKIKKIKLGLSKIINNEGIF